MADIRNEVGVTNLGPVPPGMTFLDAVRSVVPERKFHINPAHETRRLTLCETQRQIWRIASGLPEPQRSELRLLAGAAFDMGKRMDGRIKQLKAMLTDV